MGGQLAGWWILPRHDHFLRWSSGEAVITWVRLLGRRGVIMFWLRFVVGGGGCRVVGLCVSLCVRARKTS